MSLSNPLVDTYSRTALLLAFDGAPSLEAARTSLDAAGVTVRVGPRACRTASGQGATLTAVAALSRIAGDVAVDLDDPDAPTVTGPRRGRRLADTIETVNAAAHQSSPHDDNRDPATTIAEILIGDARANSDTSDPVIRVSWDGWLALCGPSVPAPGPETQPLAGAAAAAMACGEVLGLLRGHPAAARVTHRLDLWDPLGDPAAAPTDRLDARPAIFHLPPAWHLVGLGHLGQAAAWCLTLLPYPPGHPSVYLQDADRIVEANVSTGLLTSPADRDRPKTRVVAEQLEAAGARTCLIERRLGPDQHRDERDPAIALVGVDNPRTRRLISGVGWDLAVDLGVGQGPQDFSGISMHCLTSHHDSRDVRAWQDAQVAAEPALELPELPAFQAPAATATETCGLVQLATRAAGASFVGVLAATLGISEVLRRQHGAPALRSLHLEMHRLDLRRGATDPHATALPAIAVTPG